MIFKIKRYGNIVIMLLLQIGLVTQSHSVPAFPGAEGYGAITKGGRGGTLLFVTKLDDKKDSEGNPIEGTLRWALSRPYPRIVLFRTGGVINFGEIFLDGKQFSNLTIAGQSAPGDGITMRGRILIYNADELVIRYIRIRSGKGGDALDIRSGHNIIVDHVTAGWAGDEQISIVSQVIAPDSVLLKNVTMQRNLMGEASIEHPTGSILGTGDESKRNGVANLCAHHNFWVHAGHRFPNVGGNTSFKIINNVVYNWYTRAVKVQSAATVDHINNYYKKGPATQQNTWENLNKVTIGEYPLSIYTAGNLVVPGQVTVSVSDNWNQWSIDLGCESKWGSFEENDPVPVVFKRSPWQPLPPIAPYPISITSADSAWEDVLSDVGCNVRLDSLGSFVSIVDSVDSQYIYEARTGTGMHEYRVPSELVYPEIDQGEPYPDEDQDGMSDVWERMQFGNTYSANYDSLSMTDSDNDGYFDLEEFLNGTNPRDILSVAERRLRKADHKQRRFEQMYMLNGRKVSALDLPRFGANSILIRVNRDGKCYKEILCKEDISHE